MQKILKLRYVGGTVVLTIPREALETLHAKKGDKVLLTTEKDSIRITSDRKHAKP